MAHSPERLGWTYFTTHRIREPSYRFLLGCAVAYFALPTIGIWTKATLTAADVGIAIGLPLLAGALFIGRTVLQDGEVLAQRLQG